MMITTTKKLTEVQEKLDKSLADLAATTAQSKELQTKVDELVKMNDEQAKLIEELKNTGPVPVEEHEKLKKALAEALTELEKKESEAEIAQVKAVELEIKQENFKTDVANKALEIVASQGVPPLDLKPSLNPTVVAPEGDLVAQLNSIKDPTQQRAFWLANREALMSVLFNIKK